MQIVKKIKPLSVNTDSSKLDLKDTESTFLKAYEISFGKDGSNNEGGNFGVGKKLPSNFRTIPVPLPEIGANKNIGFFVSDELNEAYIFNWNSAANHGIYRLDGNTMTADTVCVRPGLNFTIDPKHAIPPNRVTLRVVYEINSDNEKVVKEKFLIFTDGYGWQRFIPVIAAIATNGFDPIAFPYFALQPPHKDADELIDLLTRPPMYAPVINPVLFTVDDAFKENLFLKKSTQFAYRYVMNDNRPTALSWYSEPFFIDPETCDINNSAQPRCVDLDLYAGGPYVEKIQLLVRFNGQSRTNAVAVDTDWALYDTIYKFSNNGGADPADYTGNYWDRTNPWEALNYNPDKNTITYRYCGDKGSTLFSPEDGTLFIQNDVPLKSFALSDTGDILLWGDNLRFYPNLPQTAIENIAMDVVDITSGNNSCPQKNVKISVYATYLWSQKVSAFKTGPSSTQVLFGVGNINGNGIMSYSSANATALQTTYGQEDGLICYLAGTSYYAIGQQYKVDVNRNKTKYQILDISNNAAIESIRDLYNSGGYIVQQFDFNVPEGEYIARLARHGADLTSDYELQSTHVIGSSSLNIPDSINPDFTSEKEFYIDARNGNVDLWTSLKRQFVLFCPFITTIYTQSWRIIEGYVKDDVDGINGIDTTTTIGIEKIKYRQMYGTELIITGKETDHNGFFFCFTSDSNNFFDEGNLARNSEVIFEAGFNCDAYNTYAFRTQINQNKKSGYFPNQKINISDVNAKKGNYVLINGTVKSCVSGNPISSVGVTASNGKTYYTDVEGNFSIRVHTLSPSFRKGKIYINGNGNCQFSTCDCTILSTIDFDLTNVTCSINDRVYPTFLVYNLKVSTISGKSLKGGGKYPVYAIGHDFGGRKTAACLIGYQDVPTFLEKGNYNPSQIRLKVTGQLQLPADIKWLTFGIGKNLVTSTYIQWVGDKIEFLDSKGNVTADGNGAVRARVTIQSLLDFNIRENFATLATYQFVDGDVCRIYDDSQGNMFDPATNGGFLDYQVLGTDFNQSVDPTLQVTTTVSGSTSTTATTQNSYDPKSFIIEYDTRLLALKDLCGFWIELKRNTPIIDNAPVYGIPGTYPVINGEIAPTEIILNAFDTFYQRRNIIITNCSGADLNHPFESQSITDYWGDNVTQNGAVLFKDDLAEQRWYLNDIIKSDAFVNLGRVNGLGICRSQNRKDFTDQDWGGIVAMHAERNILAVICQNDWFTADFRLNYAHVDQYGRVIANPDQTTGVGEPYQKVGDNFGCEYDDCSTIQFIDGIVTWADCKNSAFVLMNYRQAFDLTAIDNKGYFIEKFKYLQRYNQSINNDLNNIMETCSGINPENGNIYMTWRKRQLVVNSGQLAEERALSFVNNEREVFHNMSETFVYNMGMKKWIGWTPFTPEFYGYMPHAQSGSEFLTFAAGTPWFHNSKNTIGFNNFYGIDTDQVVNIIENFDSSKLKIMQGLAVESAKVKYFISRVLTDDKRLFSYVPLSYFKKRGNVWYSRLLRNMNTYPDPNKPKVNLLVDGKSIEGNYAEIQLVADPNKSQDYSEINNILVRFIGSEKSEK